MNSNQIGLTIRSYTDTIAGAKPSELPKMIDLYQKNKIQLQALVDWKNSMPSDPNSETNHLTDYMLVGEGRDKMAKILELTSLNPALKQLITKRITELTELDPTAQAVKTLWDSVQ
ncbi:MAG: hypothetical protein WCF65_05290 [Parachlamydiaceae bacterium]